MFLIVLNRLPWLLNLCQRADPVIVLRKNGGASCDVRHAPGGIPKGGPQAPSWSFQLGRVQGGEENEIFPSLVSFSLPLSFGQMDYHIKCNSKK
jgi:hypothetical protein